MEAMNSELYTIVSEGGMFRVFQGSPEGEPMDEMTDDQLYGWLCARGYPPEGAAETVSKIEAVGRLQVRIPN